MEETSSSKYPKADLSRALYTLLFLIINSVVQTLVTIIAVVQFIYRWVKDEPNENLLGFNESLSRYVKQLVAYVGFNSTDEPWPIGKWPTE